MARARDAQSISAVEQEIRPVNLGVLELGAQTAVGYAGRLLARQGWQVTRWDAGPNLFAKRGTADLRAWLDRGKRVEREEPTDLPHLLGWWASRDLRHPERDPALPRLILDGYRPSERATFGLDAHELATRFGLVWVSLDHEASASSPLKFAPGTPWWSSDLVIGQRLAFLAAAALALGQPGHRTLCVEEALHELAGTLAAHRPERPGGV